MTGQNEKDQIWHGDRLNRRREADTIETFILNEVSFFERMGRSQSIVLGIDGEYGKGKSWFLERLAMQLRLSHPVATIDAWADDVGDEPLTAFMAAIDDALAPYLTVSKKIGDRMAAVKAAALPVIGKLLTGAATKAISKVAGDEIEDQLGNAIEDAIRGAKEGATPKEDGAAAEAMAAAFEKLGTEIDSLVDRRGAAMLEAYRQRKRSREVFRANMRDLVALVGQEKGPGRPPLIVVIDELDRCRPNYAIRMLEEIKHFFEISGVVFIIGLHGKQLSKSVNAIYGAEFDSEDHLRRFFTRRYDLRSFSIVELVAAVFEEWGIDQTRFSYPDPIVGDGYQLTKPRIFGLILTEWSVTPREVYPIMDALRLFVEGWEHSEPIEPIALLSLVVNLVRGQQLSFTQPKQIGHIKFKETTWNTENSGNPSNFLSNDYLSNLNPMGWAPLSQAMRETPYGRDPARNYLIGFLQREGQARQSQPYFSQQSQPHFADYIPRICDLARFVDKPEQSI
ncbi:P-loop NTPase fold protein [Sphingopyxis sp. KK2]|uniref:KAP family P-loop NTPase fold protein n=1 Tax=Sphingopyxis sp. KK2 TaxID=1855727 RepID=UPI0009F8E8C4|nr:P-loop NTPase fold protein [Sphingopyxis sp. KK2]